MAWQSKYFGPSCWEIDPVLHMGWWMTANNKWSSELYHDGRHYIVLSILNTWIRNYRPTRIKVKFIDTLGYPINNLSIHVLDVSRSKVGSSTLISNYDSGDALDLNFSNKDIRFLIVGANHRGYLTEISFWEVINANTTLRSVINPIKQKGELNLNATAQAV